MKAYLKAYWHKAAAVALALAALFSLCAFSLLQGSEDVLYNITHYDLFNNLLNPGGLWDELESEIRYDFPLRMEMRDAYSAALLLQGKRESGTFYILKDNNGYLLQTNLYQEIDPNIQEYARRMGNLRRAAEEAGAKALFVGTSGKFVPGITQLPKGYLPDYASLRNLDELFLDLHAYRVPNLDLRENFKRAPLSYEYYYYRTESQWTARAAQFAAGCIAQKARDTLGVALDPEGFYSDFGNYDTAIFPNTLLGDYGRVAGVPFAGIDDFVQVIPHFETDLTVELPEEEILRRGTFTQSVLDAAYQFGKNPRYYDPKETYFSEDAARARIINHLAPNEHKLLLLCDRTFFTTAAYLALMCEEVEALVVNENSAGEMQRLVQSGEYTLVIVAMEARSIGPDMFPYYKT